MRLFCFCYLRVQQAVENGETEYTYVNDAGQEREIKLEYNPAKYRKYNRHKYG